MGYKDYPRVKINQHWWEGMEMGEGGVMIPFFAMELRFRKWILIFLVYSILVFGKKPGNFRCRKVKRKFLKVISWKSNNSWNFMRLCHGKVLNSWNCTSSCHGEVKTAKISWGHVMEKLKQLKFHEVVSWNSKKSWFFKVMSWKSFKQLKFHKEVSW